MDLWEFLNYYLDGNIKMIMYNGGYNKWITFMLM